MNALGIDSAHKQVYIKDDHVLQKTFDETGVIHAFNDGESLVEINLRRSHRSWLG